MNATMNRDGGVAEAVIISGPRRGQFVTLADETASLDDPAVEAALGNLVTAFEELVQNVRAAADEAEEWRDEVRQRRGKVCVIWRNNYVSHE